MNPNTDWPAPDEERELLNQLGTGTPVAREAVAVRYLPLLTRFLASRFARTDPDVREGAAHEVLVAFLNGTSGFDPTKGRLGAFLCRAARCDLLNLIERERKHREANRLHSVAEPAARGNSDHDRERFADHPRLSAEIAAFGPEERAGLDLLLDDTRDTATCAARLGYGHLPAREQTAVVKRVKDRVKKRLARALGDSQ